MTRVVREPTRVVRIRIAAGEPVEALRQQIRERVPHFASLTILDEAPGEAIDQPAARFRGLEQDRSAIRTRVGLIERRDEGFVEEVWEEDSLWFVSSRNQKPPSWEKALVATALYHAEAFVCLPKSAPFVNYPD